MVMESSSWDGDTDNVSSITRQHATPALLTLSASPMRRSMCPTGRSSPPSPTCGTKKMTAMQCESGRISPAQCMLTSRHSSGKIITTAHLSIHGHIPSNGLLKVGGSNGTGNRQVGGRLAHFQAWTEQKGKRAAQFEAWLETSNGDQCGAASDHRKHAHGAAQDLHIHNNQCCAKSASCLTSCDVQININRVWSHVCVLQQRLVGHEASMHRSAGAACGRADGLAAGQLMHPWVAPFPATPAAAAAAAT